MQVADYEKLGVFYLGRYYDLGARETLPDPVLYNSNDLLTHALCVGMTGSGKTGLCVDLIEEAAIDGIPTIVVDPKGDLANLLLTFPGLQGADFLPWVNPDDARKAGVSVDHHAVGQAELWREGLAKWSQDGARIQRLRDAVDFTIYTPGSNAGVPVSILSSFAAPGTTIAADPELFRERVNATVGSLLGLLGIQADPVRSREAILLGNIFQSVWQAGKDLDLAGLVQEIQNPPFSRIGVMDVETFYPAKDRFHLAMAINGLIASPGFESWLSGQPLDIQRIYYTDTGKPRVAIFSIAHLSDAERMFFVTLLLNQVLGWMRSQSGTTSLRALVYMDEIFGYFPPVANPPSKAPLLTLLKQARAFGVGIVLATQNPVDLDYKGLANIGTWFLGRLQTERDKQRILEGLEGASASQGSGFDRAAMEQTLAGLGSRVFLLHNVHEDTPALFESRWALSYLRGPMSRDQIRSLMVRASGATTPATKRTSSAPAAARLGVGTARPPAQSAQLPKTEVVRPEAGSAPIPAGGPRPVLPPAITQYFMPGSAAAEPVSYTPHLLGAAAVRFTDAKAGIDAVQSVHWLAPIDDAVIAVDWAEARDLDIDLDSLEKEPASPADFAPLPSPASQPTNYAKWSKEFISEVVTSRRLQLLRSAKLNEVSKPRETEAEFRIRLQHTARERRDEIAERLRSKYAPKFNTLNERIRRAEQAVEREATQASNAKMSTAVSFASTLLGAFLGRKTFSVSTVSRAGTSLRGVGRAIEQSQDVNRAGETVQALKQQLAELEVQFQDELATVETGYDPALEAFESIELSARKTNVQLTLFALLWVPG